jgi:hypothetical protein
MGYSSSPIEGEFDRKIQQARSIRTEACMSALTYGGNREHAKTALGQSLLSA